MSFAPPFDPFSSDVIKDIPQLLLEPSGGWDGFQFHHNLENEVLRLNESRPKGLPHLEPTTLRLDLQDVSLPDLSTTPSTDTSDAENELRDPQDEAEHDLDEAAHVWTLPEVTRKTPHTKLVTWDTFLDDSHKEPGSCYLSEANPRIFTDVLLGPDRAASAKTVKPNVMLDALFDLGMGRGSALFFWDQKEKRFAMRLEKVAMAGYSPELLQSLCETLVQTGTRTKKMQDTVNCSIRPSPYISPSRIAFLSATKSALYAIQMYLERSRPVASSLLELAIRMGKPEALMLLLEKTMAAVQRSRTDLMLLSTLMHQAADASVRDPGIARVFQEIFCRTCQPILAKLSNDAGLTCTPNDYGEDLSLDADSELQEVLNAVFNPDLAQIILETRQSLDLVRRYAPDCPVLATTSYRTSFLARLELGYTLEAVCERQSRSVAYEDAMRSLIVSAESSTSVSSLVTPASDTFDIDEVGSYQPQTSGPFHLNLGLFDRTPHLSERLEHDEVTDQVAFYLDSSEVDASPFQLDLKDALILSTTPLISAQHRLLSFSVFQLLFEEYNLIDHLNLQRDIQLLGKASFSSRLRTALFDPEQPGSEGPGRRSGAYGGLRLEARDTWPPASSELRLVLMGILSDSLAGSTDANLEDSISFAIRDMSVDELEKCREVDSIHALDFLRLQYKAPNDVLTTILAPDIMAKYDRIFQSLLRLLRVHSVTQAMLRENIDFSRSAPGPADMGLMDHGLVLEMHHFITTLADYGQNTAIEMCWGRFAKILREVKAHIANKDYERTLHRIGGHDYLRALHERTVDHMLHGLLLKKKQARTRQLLDEILTLILQFAAERRNETTTNKRHFRTEFRTKVLQFMESLRQLQGQAGQGLPNSAIEDDEGGDGLVANLFDHLLLRLDMSGYWSRRANNKATVVPLV